MNLYCCRIVEEGWGTEYTQEKDFIWAQDPEEARKLICKRWKIRKNKKGLRIEEVQVVRVEKQKKKLRIIKTAQVWNSFLQMSETQSYWSDETIYICSACEGEVKRDHACCRHCGALFN